MPSKFPRSLARAAQTIAVATGLLSLFSLPASAATNWTPVQDALHSDGVVLPGDVLRFNLVRSDLSITVSGKAVPSAELANGYVNFQQLGSGDSYFSDGALPAEEWQVPSVETALRSDGHVNISAVVNHAANESPKLLWVHFEATGTQESLVSAIGKALADIKNPQVGVTTKSVSVASYVPPEFQAIFAKGMISQVNDVYAFSLPRPDASLYFLNTVPAGPALGVGQTIFVASPTGSATDLIFNAEFALRSFEVEPISDILRAGGFVIPAQHDHFIDDHVRLYFIHAFGSGSTAMQEQALYKALNALYGGGTPLK